MRSSRHFLTAALALWPVDLAIATTLDIASRPRSSLTFPSLRRRIVDIGAFGNGSQLVDNTGDVVYSTNLTLGGKKFEVVIDTGSSDLWVIGDVPGAKNLSIESGVSYASGGAEGFIHTVELGFDDFTVSSQAFIDVESDSAFLGTQGLIGLGPSALSNVLKAVDNSSSNINVNGAPPLDRIFQQNMSTPNYLTVLLSRESDDNAISRSGQLSIGTILPSYENITNMSKLVALKDQDGIQHWQALLDSNGIRGPDGKNISTPTTVDNPTYGSSEQFRVVFDTGFTYPQVTQDVADAIYGRVPGAEWVPQDSTPGYWRIPCSYEMNISFYFANVEYPIHPLDLSMYEDDDDDENCMSTFQQIAPATANHSSFGAFDVILGMAFLRNTYLLIDFGDFVDGSNSSVADPYIQLLSTTDPVTAHKEFVDARLDGVDTTGSQEPLVSEDDAQHSDDTSQELTSSNSSDGDDNDEQWYKRWQTWAIIGGIFAALVLLLILAQCLRTRRSKVRKEAVFVPEMGSYSRLQNPKEHTRDYSQDPLMPHREYEEPKYQYGGYSA